MGAQAGMIYGVSDTSKINCSGAPHGLWTNSTFSGCDNYFSIQPGTTLQTFGDGTAKLAGTAKNPSGLLASIDLKLSGLVETFAHYKQEGGAAYDPLTDTPDIDFYTGISGKIGIGGTTYDINSFAGGYAFQFGPGANAKDPNEFGASAWIMRDGFDRHWDLNLAVAKVPEPGTLVLLATGLLALGLLRARRTI